MTEHRVLLVDDEADFVEVLAERLETRGLKVTTASSGAEAIERAQERVFDAVLLDLAMPGIDGIETLKRLRSINPDCQVILLTGHATAKKGVEAMKLGALDFLEKPTDISTLLEKIGEAATNKFALMEERTQNELQDILGKKGW